MCVILVGFNVMLAHCGYRKFKRGRGKKHALTLLDLHRANAFLAEFHHVIFFPLFLKFLVDTCPFVGTTDTPALDLCSAAHLRFTSQIGFLPLLLFLQRQM